MTSPGFPTQNVDYTDFDFDAIRTRLEQLAASVFPAWTDHQVADFGNILLDCFAFVGDVVGFYQDNQARESRIVTAKQRRSLIGLAKLVGYAPAGASAATVDATITLAAPVASGRTLTIPRGDRARTANITTATYYQLLEDLVFAEGEQTKPATLEHSTFLTATLSSTGLANQSFTLAGAPYLDASAVVTFGNGLYTRVDNFLASSATDRHFVEVVDQYDRATLVFGNGINGEVPVGNASVEYKTGGGRAGRIEAGALAAMERPSYPDSAGSLVRVSITNPAASAGGDDRESNASIAQKAPQALRVLRRAVAREDYEIVAEGVAGVARALMVTRDEDPAVPENEGRLLIIPTGGGTATTELLEQVAEQFSATGPFPKPNTFRLLVMPGTYFDIDVSSTIYVSKGHSPSQARANALAALEAMFELELEDGTANPSVNFGYYYQDADGEPTGILAWSDVFNAIRDAAGVRKVDPGASGLLLNGQRNDVEIGTRLFPRLGDVTFTDADTGLLIP